MNIGRGFGKTTIHATVTRANGTREEMRYLVGGGLIGILTRFTRKLKGAVNG